MRRSQFACALTLGLIASLSALPASAQNLLINPTFDVNLDGWDPFTGFGILQEWSSVDSASDPSSGSLYGTLPADSTFRIPIYASQCVVVAPDTLYRFGGKVLIPSSTSPTPSYGTVFANTYDSANCAGNYVENIVAPEVYVKDAWTRTSATLQTGANVGSIRVHLRVFAPANTTLRSHFDAIFLEPYEFIFVNGFE